MPWRKQLKELKRPSRFNYTLRGCGWILGIILAAGSPSGAQEEIVAKIGTTAIAAQSLRDELARRGAKTDKAAVLDEMIRFETLYAAAAQEGFEQDPEIVAGLRRLIIEKYRRQQLEPLLVKITADDAEAEGYYNQHREKFAIPATVRLAIIQIALPMRVSEEKRAQLRQRIELAREAALALSKETETFGSVAVEYSDDQASRYRGGNSGWVTVAEAEQRWPKAVNQTVLTLQQPGAVSPVVETPEGFYLVKLMERKVVTYHPLAEVKEWCRNQALLEKRTGVEKEFFAQLQKRFPVKINKEEMAKIATPPPEIPRPPAMPAR